MLLIFSNRATIYIMDDRKINYGEKAPKHPILVMNNKKYINSNNPESVVVQNHGLHTCRPVSENDAIDQTGRERRTVVKKRAGRLVCVPLSVVLVNKLMN